MLGELITLFKSAGAPTESSTNRDGAFSYAAETHAAGFGVSAGWFAVATGELRLLSLVYAAAVYGRVHGSTQSRRRVFRDIAEEPHYALGGVVVGAVFGTAVGVAAS